MFAAKNNCQCLAFCLTISLFHFCESTTAVCNDSFVIWLGVFCTNIAARPVGEASTMSLVSFEGSKYDKVVFSFNLSCNVSNACCCDSFHISYFMSFFVSLRNGAVSVARSWINQPQYVTIPK
jgi:hypothetical protein